MASDNDKKAAEEWFEKILNDSMNEQNDYIVPYQELWIPESAHPEKAFLAGCEHKQKELEQIKEQVAREAWAQATEWCVDLDERELNYEEQVERAFHLYWQQKNKGEG